MQEAHLRLFEYQRSAKLRNADAILRRIVINLSINHYHRLSAPFVFESVAKADRRGMLVSHAAGPDRMLAAEQDLDSVVSLLSAASTRTCQIFIAQRGGYSYQEIGAAFAIKPRTVEKHVAIAMEVLKDIGESARRAKGRPPAPWSPRSASLLRGLPGMAHHTIHQLGGCKPSGLGYLDEVEHVDLALVSFDAPNEVIGSPQLRCKFPLTQARRFASLDYGGDQCAMSPAA